MPLDLTAVTDKSLRFHSKDAFSDSAMKAVFVQMESLVIFVVQLLSGSCEK